MKPFRVIDPPSDMIRVLIEAPESYVIFAGTLLGLALVCFFLSTLRDLYLIWRKRRAPVRNSRR